jgi:quercetin 2,3-dioxygenase
MIYLAQPNDRHIINQGKFIIRMIAPGLKLNNPADHGLGPLGRVDHATLQPGTLVSMHPHQNDEILSYMRKGTMVHRDTHGNQVPIHNTYLMMMNAGSGVRHEEGVPQDSPETVEMLQIFMRPKANQLAPQVQFHQLSSVNSTNAWRIIGGPEESDAPLKIRSQVWLYDAHLENAAIQTPELNGLTGFLYVFDGAVTVKGQEIHQALEKGSSLILKEESLQLQTDHAADLVFFLLDEQSQFSRSGKYSG